MIHWSGTMLLGVRSCVEAFDVLCRDASVSRAIGGEDGPYYRRGESSGPQCGREEFWGIVEEGRESAGP
ncbi:hypothetical protein E2C01_088362 [Portunus trituberculatus]|uniref:Uncharacterized protein n=1 Tax=Portunus trituberculatus TaxID=210409 RepID=A0A5B7JE99_PORTR|nr:hypothetical protein [Portunus trituberculatus]